MKNRIHLAETFLAYITLLLFAFALIALFSFSTFAQHPQLARLGTTPDEVKTNIARMSLPVTSWTDGEEYTIENQYLSVLYTFSSEQLDQIHLLRKYDRKGQATAGLDSYLIYLERIQALVIPVRISPTEEVYSAFTDEAIYELHMTYEKKGYDKLSVTVQRRLPEADDQRITMRAPVPSR